MQRLGYWAHVLQRHRGCTAAVVTTAGNPDTHVILRGGRTGPNYEASHVKALGPDHGGPPAARLMVAVSHDNSDKDRLASRWWRPGRTA